MVQPWARKRKKNPKTIDLELEYTFTIKDVPCSAVHLAVERPETFQITVNGVSIDSDSECGWWCDKSLRRLEVDPSILKRGENVIHMRCAYDENHSGLEYIYLLGAFGVRIDSNGAAAITEQPRGLTIGDWTKQGLPFYSGSATCLRSEKISFRKGERIFVSLPEYRGVAARVLVDGRDAGIIAWEPNEVEITELIESDKPFDLGIEVLGHRRNSHGPFHLKEKWPIWTGPASYHMKQRQHNIVPFGIMKPPALLVKEKEK